MVKLHCVQVSSVAYSERVLYINNGGGVIFLYLPYGQYLVSCRQHWTSSLKVSLLSDHITVVCTPQTLVRINKTFWGQQLNLGSGYELLKRNKKIIVSTTALN